MSLRHFAAPRLRHSLLVTSLLLAGSFSAHAAEEMLRKAVGKGPTKWPTASRRMRCGSPHHRVVRWTKAGWFTVLTPPPST
ncbi:putative receptor [Klebsiella pneumoniae]|nr:putative receptor [Klebsiella pneumoniae]